MKTKKDIFNEHLKGYLKADKPEKGKILDHVCFVTKMHRNAAMRKFRVLQLKDPCKEEKRGRSVFYTPDVVAALHEIWEIAGRACGELLHSVIEDYVRILMRDKQWKHRDEVTDKLLFMSMSTVKRKTSDFAIESGKKKGFGTTKPSLIKTMVPVFSGPWDNVPAGYGQTDTVVHCGETLFGDYVYTCNHVDAKTFWIVPRAQWNKGQEATKKSLEDIKKRLPFPLLGTHFDSGNEFINNVVAPWCFENNIKPTRSRPGKKNDNMNIEERNGHVIRKYVGYGRLDNIEVVEILNEFYDVLADYLNHFIPVRRCIEKIKINSKYKRKYEARAKTAYQRVLEEKTISEKVKTKLRNEHEKLNPLILRKEVERLQKKVYDVGTRYENLKRLS